MRREAKKKAIARKRQNEMWKRKKNKENEGSNVLTHERKRNIYLTLATRRQIKEKNGYLK